MKKTYYKLQAQVVPGWTLPHETSLKVESITVRPHPSVGSLEVKKRQIQGGLSSRLMDTSRLIDPPHVVLANLGLDQPEGVASDEQVLRFTARYGLPGVGGDALLDEPEIPFWLDVAVFHDHQKCVREAWRKQDHRLFTVLKGFENVPHDNLTVTWEVKRGALEMRFASWHQYAGILLARDIAAGLAKICKNKECPAPYFISERHDQRYCSAECSKPAKRGAKLKWWRKNRQGKSRSRR